MAVQEALEEDKHGLVLQEALEVQEIQEDQHITETLVLMEQEDY